MSLGAKIRRAMGPFERPVSNFYRSLFIDLSRLISEISANSSPQSILEIGCGEGAMTELLQTKFPDAHITGIDIAPSIGRQFTGGKERVEFIQTTVDEFAADGNKQFDLILVCDVLHHVPWEIHESLLSQAATMMANGGVFIVKDWENRPNPINWISYLLERYITGDKVKYKTEKQWLDLIERVFGVNKIKHEKRIRPWINNIMFVVGPES